MHLAVVIVLFARKVIGWSMSLSPDTRLTGKALRWLMSLVVSPKVSCSIAIKVVTISVVNTANYCGVFK